EQLVERDGDEVGLELAEVEPVRRHECRAIHEYVPPGSLRLSDPLERMLDAREVRLGWVCEQIAPPSVRPTQAGVQSVLVDAQRTRRVRQVGGRRAPRAGELAEP